MILLDLGLPYRSGGALLHDLKTDPATAGIPVLVVSALAETLTPERRALTAGVVAKPFSPDTLRAARRLPGRAQSPGSPSTSPGGVLGGLRGLRLDQGQGRQLEPEAGPAAAARPGPHPPPVALHDGLDDGQPQPDPFGGLARAPAVPRGGGAVEGLEEALGEPLRQARATIQDADQDALRAGAEGDLDRGARPG